MDDLFLNNTAGFHACIGNKPYIVPPYTERAENVHIVNQFTPHCVK